MTNTTSKSLRATTENFGRFKRNWNRPTSSGFESDYIRDRDLRQAS